MLGIFRDMDKNTETTISEAISLLLIAQNETKNGGLTVTELGKKGDFSLASASRYIRSLSVVDRQGRDGLGLVTAERDPMDDRKKILRVSPEGFTVITKVLKALEK